MSAAKSRRPVVRSMQSFTAAVAAISWSAEQSSALTINQWTGNAGTTQWSNINNWLNGNIPNSGDLATVYNGTIGLNGTPPSVGGVNLFNVGSSASLYTEGYKLNVLGTLGISGGTLVVQASPSGSVAVQAPTITMTNGAELTMIDSTARVRVSSTSSGTPNGTLSVDATSYIYADGTIDTATYTNNGALYAADPSTINATTFTLAGTAANPALISTNGNVMTINATTFELHDYNTKIDLSSANSNLTLQGTPDTGTGYIGAEVDIGDTSTLSLGGGPWIFGYYQKSGAIFLQRGSINMAGGPTLARAAQINSNAYFETGVNVTAGYASLNGPEFDGGSSTSIAAGAHLYTTDAYFRTASSSQIYFSGPGNLVMNGATQIGYSSSGIPYTTVNIQAGTLFDWDGTSGANASTTIDNGELDIYASTIDTAIFFPGYYGTLTVNGGSQLNVAGTPWTLYGTMTLGPGAVVQGQTLTISPGAVPLGSYALTPTSSGSTFPIIQAPVVINTNSVIYMGFNGGLHLDGATTWAGGSVISAPFISPGSPYGVLVQDGNATVTANTSIFCNTLDMDGTADTASWTVNAGVTFLQQAYYLDTPGSSTNPFHSVLNLNGGIINMQTSAGVWTLAGGTINMNLSGGSNASVQGDKLILGSGALKGTINAGNVGLSSIAALQSAATSVAGGNVLNVSSGSILVLSTFGSDANALLTKTGSGKLFLNGTQTHAAGSQIVVSQGEMDLNTDAGAGGANLNLNASGGSTVVNVTQKLAILTVGSGATVSLTPVVFPATRLAISATLNMSGGTLNISNDDIFCHNGNLTSLTASVKAGYNGGLWNGVGINSSNASSDAKHLHAVGVILNKNSLNSIIYTSIDSQPTVITDALIRYTYYGDTDVDGKVDGSDYSRVDAAYLADKSNANAATGWYNGDFNYDGATNGSDYTLIDNAFNSQGAQLADQVATPTAQIAGSAAAVPEPASMGLIGLMAAGLLGRRRRVV